MGDLFGMRMYSTSCGTMSSSHLAETNCSMASGRMVAVAAGARPSVDCALLASMDGPSMTRPPFYRSPRRGPGVGLFRQIGAGFAGFATGAAAIGWMHGVADTVSTGRGARRQEWTLQSPKGTDMKSAFAAKASLFASTLALSLLLAAAAHAADKAPMRGVDKVNLNTADAATIDRVLLNIGAAKAQAIVAYRKEHG